jgi:hypothetical protein
VGRQTRFFIDKHDRYELLCFAERRGFRTVPQIIKSDTVPEAQPPTAFRTDAESEDASFFYLLPKGFSAVEAFYQKLPHEPGLSKLLARTSPVIEFSLLEMTSDQPTEGRIYFCDAPDDPRFDRALRAYNTLARYIRKWPRTSDGAFHVGPHIAESCRNGDTTITYGGKPLEIA